MPDPADARIASHAPRPPAAGRVFVFATVIALVALALTVAEVRALDRFGPVGVPWLALLALFVLAEAFPVHLEHRRETLSFSLSMIPLVVGLYTLTPLALVTARVLGAILALVVRRRQGPLKLSVNVASFWLEAATAIAVFHLLAEPGRVGVASWGPAFAAVLASDLVQTVVLSIAISLYQRRWDQAMLGPFLAGSVAHTVDASAGLLVVTLLVSEPAAVVLFAVVAAMLLASYHVYRSLREKHRNLVELYDFTRRMGDALLADRVLPTLLDESRELLHAEQVRLFVQDVGGPVAVVELAAGGAVTTAAVEPGSADERLHRDACAHGEPQLIDDGDAMIAPLVGTSGLTGVLLVSERSGQVRSFNAGDLHLFATVANHAAMSLENSTLVQRLRTQAAEAKHQSLHDALTGLPNRVQFHDRLEDHVGRGGPCAVLLLDLDRFKEVNDTLGHLNGDLLLCEVGGRLRAALRTGDLVARLGGDEFAILLPDVTTPDAAVHVARAVVAELERPFEVADVAVGIGASVGVAFAPDHGTDANLLLQRADVAMYTAKGDRTGVELYSLERDENTLERLSLVGSLRQAIADGALQVHYQPQLDLATGRVLGAEALVRWHDETLGWVPPDRFVPVAENTGLIRPLTLFVLERALDRCATWRRAGRALRISVNLSAQSLLQPTLVSDVANLLERTGVPASALCLELTETSMLVDPRRTVAALHELRELGVTVAIDDFGTGHSSLAYLKELPVGEIKIDKSFVRRMTSDRFDEAIVCSIVDLARHLVVPVVAEGIEDGEVAERLRVAGCAFGQGYWFSRPLAPDAFDAWLATARVSP